MDDPVLGRRSIRKYTREPVPDESVELLLRAAMSAPSAGNEQPWEFVVIHDRQLLDHIPSVHPYSHMLKEAPLAILVCADLSRKKYEQYWIQDCAAATENILVEAAALGLGSVWLGVYPMDTRVEGIRRILGLPEHVVPFSLVAIGHPAETKPPADRYDAARVHCDGW